MLLYISTNMNKISKKVTCFATDFEYSLYYENFLIKFIAHLLRKHIYHLLCLLFSQFSFTSLCIRSLSLITVILKFWHISSDIYFDLRVIFL
jgi:hypothetical protein